MSFAALTIDINAKLAGLESGLKRAEQMSAQTASKMDRVGSSFAALGRLSTGALGGLALGTLAKQALDVADGYTRIASQLKVVTDTTQAAMDAQEGLFRVAQSTRQGMDGVVQTFVAFARSSDELGVSQQRLIRITETISQAVALSGASAESANAALIQLGQGIASGTLRGEELNSVLEQTPVLARALAEGMGVGIGQLREMGAAGEITGQRVIEALERIAPSIEKQFASVTPTVSDAFTQMTNSAGRLVDRINDVTAAGQILVSIMSTISRVVDRVADAAGADARGAAERMIAQEERRLANLSENDPFRKVVEERLRNLKNAYDVRWASFEREMQRYKSAGEQAARGAEGPTKAYQELVERLSGVNKDFYKHLNTLHAEFQREGIGIEEYRTQVEKLIKTYTDAGKAAETAGPSGRDVNKELSQEIDQLSRRLSLVGANTQADQALFDITTGRFNGALPELQQELLGLAQRLDLREREIAMLALIEDAQSRDGERQRQAADDLREQADRWKDLIDPTREYLRQIEEIRRLVQSGNLTPQQGEAAEWDVQNRIQDVIDPVTDETKKVSDAAREMGLTFQSAFEDAIINGEKLKDVIAGIGQDMARVFIRKSITEPLMSWISDLFPSANGNVFDKSGVLKKFADGGIVSGPMAFPFAGGMGLMGEAGPEAIMPLKRGRNGKLGVAATGGRSVTINQSFTFNGATSRTEAYAIVQAARQQTIADMREASFRGETAALGF